jgi:hypothetical protein
MTHSYHAHPWVEPPPEGFGGPNEITCGKTPKLSAATVIASRLKRSPACLNVFSAQKPGNNILDAPFDHFDHVIVLRDMFIAKESQGV